jgi:hypothetical protein
MCVCCVSSYANLLASHFSDSFLSSLPDKMSAWFHLDTPADDMLIVKPDLQNNFVTFRVKTHIENFNLPESVERCTPTESELIACPCGGSSCSLASASSPVVFSHVSDEFVSLNENDIVVGNWRDFKGERR